MREEEREREDMTREVERQNKSQTITMQENIKLMSCAPVGKFKGNYAVASFEEHQAEQGRGRSSPPKT